MELSLDEKFYDEIEDDIELNFDNARNLTQIRLMKRF